MCDVRKVRVRGRGIQSRGIRIGDVAKFFIYTEGAGIEVPEVEIIGPGGSNQNVEIDRLQNNVFEGLYYPTKEGRYIIMIKLGGLDVPRAPFDITVGPRIQIPIIAHGLGLHGGLVGHDAAFVVEMNGETGALGFSVAGPSQVTFDSTE